MKEYHTKISDIEVEIRNQSIIIDETIIIKMLNNLKESFVTYLTILNESARNESKFLERSILFKNLIDEESRMRLDTITTNFASRFNNKKKSKKNKNENEKKRNKSKDSYTCYKCEIVEHYQ